MKNLLYIFICATSLIQIACSSFAQQKIYEQVRAERKPFQKSPYQIKSPTEHVQRELDNGKSYDPNPKVIVIDEKSGKYEFRWIGTDGKEKIIYYQRKDAIEAVVEAKIEKIQDGKFLYKYDFKILPTSPLYFREFTVQTLATDTKPIELDNRRINENEHRLFSIGSMSKANPIFADGIWWDYAFVGTKEERIYGGKTIEFQLTSSNLPGIVNCKATGGEIAIKGVGQDIPSVLENEIPIFEDMAWGYTISPVERLSTLSKVDRAKYLLENLAKFQEAGWMSEGTAKNYEAILKREDLAGAFEKAKKDLENEFITSEVFHIIEGLNQ